MNCIAMLPNQLASIREAGSFKCSASTSGASAAFAGKAPLASVGQIFRERLIVILCVSKAVAFPIYCFEYLRHYLKFVLLFIPGLVRPFPISNYEVFRCAFRCLHGIVKWTVFVPSYNTFRLSTCTCVSKNYVDHNFLLLKIFFLTILLFQYNSVADFFYRFGLCYSYCPRCNDSWIGLVPVHNSLRSLGQAIQYVVLHIRRSSAFFLVL